MPEPLAFTLSPDGAVSLDKTGANVLRGLLAEYEASMASAEWVGEERLAPGLSRQEILDQFATIGLTPPEELVTYFEWHNSITPPRPGLVNWAHPCFSPGTLEWCIANYRANVRTAPEDAWWFKPGWFNLEEASGFAVSCMGDPDDSPEVLFISPDDPFEGARQYPRMVSLCTVFGGWIVLIRSGVYFWRDNRWFVDVSKLDGVRPVEAVSVFR